MLSKAIALLAFVGATQAHMHLSFPPTFKGDNNPHTQGQPDAHLNYPFGCCGQEPKSSELCKGHLDLLDTDEGKSTASWAAGQKANFSLSGLQIEGTSWNPVGGTHAGGSCQASFSIDKGKTFKVVKSWQGNCPPHDNPSLEPEDQVFDFTVPQDLPTGDVVFAWTWTNREKEFNMNCAAVTITGGDGDTPQEPEQPSPTSSAGQPSQTSKPSAPNSPPDQEQYTLEGCQCSCPSQTWSEGCQCYSCDSPSTSRRNVERKALVLHKRRVQQAKNMRAPVRRDAVVKFASAPETFYGDFEGVGLQCQSPGNPAELKYPNPGADVVETPGNDGYELVEPTCS